MFFSNINNYWNFIFEHFFHYLKVSNFAQRQKHPAGFGECCTVLLHSAQNNSWWSTAHFSFVKIDVVLSQKIIRNRNKLKYFFGTRFFLCRCHVDFRKFFPCFQKFFSMSFNIGDGSVRFQFVRFGKYNGKGILCR